MKILHIDSSITGPQSVSRKLSATVIERLKQLHQDAEIIYRDVCSPEIPHQSNKLIQFKMNLAKGDHKINTDTLIQHQYDLVNGVLEEFLAADVVVVGVPMYNLSIPSQLKCWIDSVSVAGKTFRYTETGPQGLCAGKKVIIASVRGGIYSTPEAKTNDHEERYLISLFNFLGISDVSIIRAEGVNISPEFQEKAMGEALSEIEEFTLV